MQLDSDFSTDKDNISRGGRRHFYFGGMISLRGADIDWHPCQPSVWYLVQVLGSWFVGRYRVEGRLSKREADPKLAPRYLSTNR